jgi:hypothetical protein
VIVVMSDEQQVTDLMQRHGLEIQVGLTSFVWQVRVRGYDPTGALHEDSFPASLTVGTSLTKAMALAIQLFCIRYGIPV